MHKIVQFILALSAVVLIAAVYVMAIIAGMAKASFKLHLVEHEYHVR